MKRSKRIKAELYLPIEIIQHIQSFMSGKEAARTTTLSKSWKAAWLTRPDLDFDEQHFGGLIRFWTFVKKNMKRYFNRNLKIHSFRLRINSANYPNNFLVPRLITKALRIGATDLDFTNNRPNWAFFLPHQVFGSENLIRLSVRGCRIGTVKVKCWGLKSLTLERVVVGGALLSDIISSCPMIQYFLFSLSKVEGLNSFLVFGKEILGSVVHCPFNNLKRLIFYGIDVHTQFFDDLKSKFPCLKDLAILECGGYQGLNICSPSLECVWFIMDRMLRVKLDVPSIRRFTFSGRYIPSLSFKTTTSEFESDISIAYHRYPKAAWFVKLNKLLTRLSPSKISLSLKMCLEKRFDFPGVEEGLPKPVVENLTILWPKPNSVDLLDGLFWYCRPIYVTQHWVQSEDDQTRYNNFIKFVYKRVKLHANLKCMCWIGECVDVEFFDEAVSAWLPRSTDALTSPGADKHRIRLHLRWGH